LFSGLPAGEVVDTTSQHRPPIEARSSNPIWTSRAARSWADVEDRAERVRLAAGWKTVVTCTDTRAGFNCNETKASGEQPISLPARKHIISEPLESGSNESTRVGLPLTVHNTASGEWCALLPTRLYGKQGGDLRKAMGATEAAQNLPFFYRLLHVQDGAEHHHYGLIGLFDEGTDP